MLSGREVVLIIAKYTNYDRLGPIAQIARMCNRQQTSFLGIIIICIVILDIVFITYNH
jgi:hypothetical protein